MHTTIPGSKYYYIGGNTTKIKQILPVKDAEQKAESVDFVLLINLIYLFATTPNGYKSPGRRQTAYNAQSMFMVSQVVAAHKSIAFRQ